jgi:hypothetical protein
MTTSNYETPIVTGLACARNIVHVDGKWHKRCAHRKARRLRKAMLATMVEYEEPALRIATSWIA